jgi:excisionase family DNA binding protein
MEHYATVNETCDLLGVCRSEVYNKIWRRELTSDRIGKRRMISRASVSNELAKRAARAAIG